MGRRNGKAAKRLTITETQDPVKRKLYFQELPSDVQQIIFEGVKFRSFNDYCPEDAVQFGLDDLIDEEADDFINRHNTRRTLAEWLQFAEKGK